MVGSSVVAAVVVALGSLRGAGAFSGPAPAPTQAGVGAVLLVPGYGGGTATLDVLADRIRATGRITEIVRIPGNGTGDLTAQAAVLNGYVNRVLRAGNGLVDVIGFSAGGVVARLWDVQDGGAGKAGMIITLGSPLNGTRLAAAGNAADPSACPTACQQLVPGGALLTRLQKVPLTRRPAWLSLWTAGDQVVRPPDSARLTGAVNVPLQAVCPDEVVAHGQLPSDPLVIGIVLRALDGGPLAAPRRADCTTLRALGSFRSAVGPDLTG